MMVDLMKQMPYGNWATVARKDQGWGKCSGTYQPKYTCAGTSSSFYHQTQVSLTAEAQGQYDSQIADSKTIKMACI